MPYVWSDYADAQDEIVAWFLISESNEIVATRIVGEDASETCIPFGKDYTLYMFGNRDNYAYGEQRGWEGALTIGRSEYSLGSSDVIGKYWPFNNVYGKLEVYAKNKLYNNNLIPDFKHAFRSSDDHCQDGQSINGGPWKDSRGRGCDNIWYTKFGSTRACGKFAFETKEVSTELSANDMCCSCGGGIVSEDAHTSICIDNDIKTDNNDTTVKVTDALGLGCNAYSAFEVCPDASWKLSDDDFDHHRDCCVCSGGGKEPEFIQYDWEHCATLTNNPDNGTQNLANLENCPQGDGYMWQLWSEGEMCAETTGGFHGWQYRNDLAPFRFQQPLSYISADIETGWMTPTSFEIESATECLTIEWDEDRKDVGSFEFTEYTIYGYNDVVLCTMKTEFCNPKGPKAPWKRRYTATFCKPCCLYGELDSYTIELAHDNEWGTNVLKIDGKEFSIPVNEDDGIQANKYTAQKATLPAKGNDKCGIWHNTTEVLVHNIDAPIDVYYKPIEYNFWLDEYNQLRYEGGFVCHYEEMRNDVLSVLMDQEGDAAVTADLVCNGLQQETNNPAYTKTTLKGCDVNEPQFTLAKFYCKTDHEILYECFHNKADIFSVPQCSCDHGIQITCSN